VNDLLVGSAHAAVRAATADVHERLHGLPTFVRILDGSIALADYRALLLRLHGFHGPLEAAFVARADDFARHGIDIRQHRRVPALRDDIEALGDVVPAQAAERLDIRGSIADLFGRFYVREGSMLGGGVMARRLDALFGTKGRGRRWFAGDAGVGARWRVTCAAIERVAPDEPSLADLVAGATDCFERFERWMA
jgi:heme oxygenase